MTICLLCEINIVLRQLTLFIHPLGCSSHSRGYSRLETLYGLDTFLVVIPVYFLSLTENILVVLKLV